MQQEKNNEENIINKGEHDEVDEPGNSYSIESEEGEEEGKHSLQKNKLKQEIGRLKKEKEEYLQGWQRERASFANFQKEQENRSEAFRSASLRDILSSLIELLDSLDLAEAHAPAVVRDSTWFPGLQHIEKQTRQILLRYGVEEIPTKEGEQFQTEMHEAIEQVESEKPSGTILSILQKGYRLGDRVLRATRVTVAK